MEYRKLVDFLNYVVVAYNEALSNMGIDVNLVLVQMARAFKEKAAHLIEKNFKLDVTGNDIKGIVESFIQRIKKTGICQKARIEEFNENKFIIKLGDSILHQANQIFLEDKPKGFIPPTPIISMLHAYVEEGSGKRFSIDSYEFIPEENSAKITISLE
ncbi:MAG: hypothetical protein ACTSRW_17055 [Candidatus Helarchaeota archaeon]